MLVDVPKVEVKVRHGDQGGLVNELVVGVRCVGGADRNKTNGGWGGGARGLAVNKLVAGARCMGGADGNETNGGRGGQGRGVYSNTDCRTSAASSGGSV